MGEGSETPKSTDSSASLIPATLNRGLDGKYHLVFKHDSSNNSVAIEKVGLSDVADDRGLLRVDDVVARVNGVRTVRDYPD